MMRNKMCDNSFFHQSLEGIKVLVLVPHQDDEINLMRDLLVSLQSCKAIVYVAYTTNGDYSIPASVRYKEAIHSLDILGISRDQIIFLGYSDSFNDSSNSHIFYANSEPAISNAGYCETYGANGIKEFAYKELDCHHLYTKDNYISDLELLLQYIDPDIIFAIDYDTHPDHRMLSSGLDSALYRMKLKKPSFKPMLYKGFAYATAFHSYKDFYNSLNLKSVKEPVEFDIYHYFGSHDICGASIYQWQNRVRFPVIESSRGPFLFNSILFKAMKAHTSQSFGFRATAVMNSDVIFWHRRTDSIAYEANVEVSSNQSMSNNLTDVKLFDILDIDNLQPVLDPVCWQSASNDLNPSIQLRWNTVQDIRQIILYSAIYFSSSTLRGCSVYIDDDLVYTGIVPQYGRPLVISLDRLYTADRIRITFDGYVEIAEVEVYSDFAQHDVIAPFIKIMKDDDFIYDYYIDENVESIDISLYTYMVDVNHVIYSIDGHSTIVDSDDNCCRIILAPKDKTVVITAAVEGQPNCYDRIVIHRLSSQLLYFKKLLQVIDQHINIFLLRLRRKWYYVFCKK